MQLFSNLKLQMFPFILLFFLPFSSSTTCGDKFSCFIMENNLLEVIYNVEIEAICQILCQNKAACMLYTWFYKDSTTYYYPTNTTYNHACFLFSSCDQVDNTCVGCFTGPPECSTFTAGTISNKKICDDDLAALNNDPTITMDQSSYTSGTEMLIYFNIGSNRATNADWIGIYPWDISPGGYPHFNDWQYVCGGRSVCDSAVESGLVIFTSILTNGKWAAWYFVDNGYKFLGWIKFSVSGYRCAPATVGISPTKHLYAQDGLEASKIAFSSCYKPESVRGDYFWNHVRNIFRADVWLWLGDNMYENGIDLNKKRIAYNTARDQVSYVSYGPVREGSKIPVMATWDDHDYAFDDMGKGYVCTKESQDEFVTHFNIPATDPRHTDYPEGQQTGVYNARMLRQPGTVNSGIHVIVLDARSGRDPTYPFFGPCKGANSQMLTDTQWTWLDKELSKTSVVKIIASGIQVLMPTNLEKPQSGFCSDDSHSSGSTTTFMDAIMAVGEDSDWKGTVHESWGEIPQERAKLLGMVQRSINTGNTKVAIFLSGDQHWAELMAKRMPYSTIYGPSQILYEITGSGVHQGWDFDVHNSNRLRDRTCDHQGSGPYNQACVFPWTYKGKTYNTCAQPDAEAQWCSTKTNSQGNYLRGYWGYCDSIKNELAELTLSNSTQTCTGSKFHICTAQANYGAVEVDFENKKIKMSIITPFEEEAASHQVSF